MRFARYTILPVLWLILSMGPESVPGAEIQAAPERVPDRYLLIIDISSPMRARMESVQECITGLLVSGMQGQLHEGDQLGIWTYNNQLHTGEFPLVEWSESTRNDIVRTVLQFLKQQRFSGTTDFSKVMPDIMDVVAHSKRITVILFSDGDESIQGTPFDGAIANYFRENADALKEKRAPIVTILRGDKGRWIGHTISYPPWPIEFPSFPPEPKPQPNPAPAASTTQGPDISRTLATTNKGPIVFAEPLIVSGRQGQSNQPAEKTAPAFNPPAAAATDTNAPQPVPAEIPTAAEPAAQPDPTPIAQTQVGGDVPTKDSRLPGAVIAVGLAALGAVALVGLFLLRRPRPHRRASLITRSMDKRRRG